MTLKIATHFEIGSIAAIPAASFVIIRRVSILLDKIDVTSQTVRSSPTPTILLVSNK